jgi:hypothetical protein
LRCQMWCSVGGGGEPDATEDARGEVELGEERELLSAIEFGRVDARVPGG